MSKQTRVDPDTGETQTKVRGFVSLEGHKVEFEVWVCPDHWETLSEDEKFDMVEEEMWNAGILDVWYE